MSWYIRKLIKTLNFIFRNLYLKWGSYDLLAEELLKKFVYKLFLKSFLIIHNVIVPIQMLVLNLNYMMLALLYGMELMEHWEDFKTRLHIINNLLEYFHYLKFEKPKQVELIQIQQKQTYFHISLIFMKTIGILHKELHLTGLFQRIPEKEGSN